MRKTTLLLLTVLLMVTSGAVSQKRNMDVYKLPEMDNACYRKTIRIPDIDGYKTLKCDFHTHTAFSDGLLWPDARVDEAWAGGLDVIAITDHIEWRPHHNRDKYITSDHNASADIAQQRAKRYGMIVVRGSEITRSKPFGHMNALFVKDANELEVKDPEAAIDAALAQGAFIMWNHPGWPNDTSTLYDVQKKMMAEKKLHGIEVFNDRELYPVSFDWCNQYGVAFMGNSDIHNTIEFTYSPGLLTRPFTLVFASEYTEDAVKEALFAGRTLVQFNGNLIGKEEYLEKIFHASLKTYRRDSNKKVLDIENNSDIDFTVAFDQHRIVIRANATTRMQIADGKQFTVVNCISASDKRLMTSF